MKELFSLDAHDYNVNGKVFRRPSARGIVIRDGKLLVIYSEKQHGYKPPGGGIEKDEDPVCALIREVKEETGRVVIPESVREFGMVIRKNKDTYDENAIFEQVNYYYYCDVTDEASDTALDEHELEEGFIPLWVDPMEAARFNTMAGGDIMIRREARVFEMIAEEMK